MADRRQKVARFWDRHADIYDRFIERRYSKGYERFRRIFFKFVKRKQKVLDVCTGTGDIALVLAKRSNDVSGVDISSEMVRHAKAKVGERPQFLVDDACELDYERGTFDLLTCCNGLQALQGAEKALKEMRRVLKSRGKLVTITYAYSDATFGQLLGLMSDHIRLGRPPIWRHFEGKELRRLHSEAGFKILKCEYCWKDPPAVLCVARK